MKPSLTFVSRKTGTHGSYVTFIPVESTGMSIPCKNQHPFLVSYVLSESQNVRTGEKNAVPPDMERRTKRVIPGFRPVRSLLDAVGPSPLSDTDLPPGTALREGNVGP